MGSSHRHAPCRAVPVSIRSAVSWSEAATARRHQGKAISRHLHVPAGMAGRKPRAPAAPASGALSRSSAKPILPFSTTTRNFTKSFRRSNMALRLAHPDRRIEFRISMDRAAGIPDGRAGCSTRRYAGHSLSEARYRSGGMNRNPSCKEQGLLYALCVFSLTCFPAQSSAAQTAPVTCRTEQIRISDEDSAIVWAQMEDTTEYGHDGSVERPVGCAGFSGRLWNSASGDDV